MEDIEMEIFAQLHGWANDDNEVLASLSHSGIPHEGSTPHSGRYPWGSGDNSLQHDWDFKARYTKFKRMGMTDTQIAKAFEVYQKDSKGNPIPDPNGGFKGNSKALRAQLQIATENIKADNYARIDALRCQGMGWTDIAKKLNLPNESTARSAWERGQKKVANKTAVAADALKEACDKYGFIDVGSGSNLSLGVSSNAFDTALERLKSQGYVVQNIYQPQIASPLQKTTVRVLCKPGTKAGDAWKNRDHIKLINEDAHGKVKLEDDLNLHPIPSLSSSRVKIRFGDEGGKDQDGLIEIRAVKGKNGELVPACKDLSLQGAKYAQVRIAVDGKYYIKGMARYNPDLQEGTDILVNSNKDSSKGLSGALKPLGKSSDNPFGTNVVATGFKGEDGKLIRSPLNIVGTIGDEHKEGAWGEWGVNLPAQFLSKQPEQLVKQQLKATRDMKEKELAEIKKLTNPVVKKQMLIDFADQADAAAVDLKAVKLKGQGVRVLLPLTSIKDNEVYAPQYANGTQVALVRYPHAGPFEIPVLTVNNGNREGNTVMKNAKDAIGINSKNAAILSGADFDGDTVTVIPLSRVTKSGTIEKTVTMRTHNDIQIPSLQSFDPTGSYGPDNYGWDPNSDKKAPYTLMSKRQKGIQMGVVSNLITDMYARGCEDVKELERADKYSMVVIDAEKHKLNYKQAEKDFNIEELRRKYQENPNNSKGYGGASSLLSRSKSTVRVTKRDLRYEIDPKTGAKIPIDAKNNEYSSSPKIRAKDPNTGRLIKDENGKAINETVQGSYKKNKDGSYTYDQGANPGSPKNRFRYDESKAVIKTRQQESTRMAEASDARTLLSDYDSRSKSWSGSSLPIERMYAEYANSCKALANDARKESLAVPHLKYSPSAAKEYSAEVASLKQKYQNAIANRPRERQAQLLATAKYHAEEEDHPEWDNDDKKKHRGIAIQRAREITGAHKDKVEFTDREWEAIQKGAIAEKTLMDLLKQADKESYTKLATPRDSRVIPDSTRSAIQNMYESGLYTQAEIAARYGVSSSEVSQIVA